MYAYKVRNIDQQTEITQDGYDTLSQAIDALAEYIFMVMPAHVHVKLTRTDKGIDVYAVTTKVRRDKVRLVNFYLLLECTLIRNA